MGVIAGGRSVVRSVRPSVRLPVRRSAAKGERRDGEEPGQGEIRGEGRRGSQGNLSVTRRANARQQRLCAT